MWASEVSDKLAREEIDAEDETVAALVDFAVVTEAARLVGANWTVVALSERDGVAIR